MKRSVLIAIVPLVKVFRAAPRIGARMEMFAVDDRKRRTRAAQNVMPMKFLTLLLFAVGVIATSGLAVRADGTNNARADDARRLNSALLRAAKYGQFDDAKELLDEGAPFDSTRFYGRLALVEAADEGRDIGFLHPEEMRPGYQKLVRLLLERGAKVNAQATGDKVRGGWANGRTALMQASEFGSEAIADILLARGADVNLKDSQGTTAFMLAARGDSMAIMRQLAARGARINDRNQRGYNALMLASLHSLEKTRFLLDNGAEVNARTRDGATALMMAVYGERREAIRLYVIVLLAPEDLIVDSEPTLDIMRLLLARGANVNAQTRGGTTALLQAVHLGAPQTVRLLLEAGANPDIKDENQGTPRQLANRLRDEWNEQYRQTDVVKIQRRLRELEQVAALLEPQTVAALRAKPIE